jgi:hypothetical protein
MYCDECKDQAASEKKNLDEAAQTLKGLWEDRVKRVKDLRDENDKLLLRVEQLGKITKLMVDEEQAKKVTALELQIKDFKTKWDQLHTAYELEKERREQANLQISEMQEYITATRYWKIEPMDNTERRVWLERLDKGKTENREHEKGMCWCGGVHTVH